MEEKKERKSIINELFSKSYFKTLELLKLVFLVAIIEFVIIIFQAVINYQISSRYTNTPFIVMVDNKTKDILNVRVIEDDKIDKDILREAIERTSEHRGSIKSVSQYKEVVDLFKISGTTKTLWEKYIKSNPYAKDIDFLETITAYEKIGECMLKTK